MNSQVILPWICAIQLRFILHFGIVRAAKRADCHDIAVKSGERENANVRANEQAIPQRRLLNDSTHRADG